MLTFTGTHWKVHHGDEVAIEGTLKLFDVTSTPLKLDFKPKGLGPIRPWIMASIVKDTLTASQRSGRRPDSGGMDISNLSNEFATKDGDGRTSMFGSEPNRAAFGYGRPPRRTRNQATTNEESMKRSLSASRAVSSPGR
jgi:hypothetical protein